MPKYSAKKVKVIHKFQAGQRWSNEVHYDWASFGELPTDYEIIHIIRRTPHMVIYHFGDQKIYRSKIKTFPGEKSEYFATGVGTATTVYNTSTMTLLE